MKPSLVLAILLLTSIPLVAAEIPDADAIQGQWRPASVIDNGDETPQEDLDEATIRFSGNKFVGVGKRKLQGEFSLDKSSEPRHIDLHVKGENDVRLTVNGIYQLKADELKICIGAGPGAPRPNDFTSLAGERRTLIVFRRIPDVDGTWQRQGQTEDGAVIRVVKTHDNGNTTVTYYDNAGTVIQQHRSKYKLRDSDDVRVFTFFDLEVTEGAAKGQKLEGSSSYAYRIEGDTFYEFRGVLKDDSSSAPDVVAWQRVVAE